jgi:hypothetical protein
VAILHGCDSKQPAAWTTDIHWESEPARRCNAACRPQFSPLIVSIRRPAFCSSSGPAPAWRASL